MWNFTIVLLILVQMKVTIISNASTNDDFRSSIIKTEDSIKMVGYTFHTFRVASLFECAQCLVAKSCQSFNYNKASRDCYCFNNTGSDDINDLVYADGYVFGESVCL